MPLFFYLALSICGEGKTERLEAIYPKDSRSAILAQSEVVDGFRRKLKSILMVKYLFLPHKEPQLVDITSTFLPQWWQIYKIIKNYGLGVTIVINIGGE